MGIHFLFPSHALKASAVDEMFADQWATVTKAGLSASLLTDSVIQQNKPLKNVPAGATVVYRGWMLNCIEYGRLSDAILGAAAKSLTSTSTYLAAHHLPNWYPLISEFTPETKIFPVDADLESELRSLDWGAFFVKDYVKSLKTNLGSIVRDPSQIRAVVAEMRQYRGDIEGGYCVRRVEQFISDSEQRFFVLNGRAFGPTNGPMPELIAIVAERIPSPFFSIDLIRRADGVMRVVEIGDGQVSDLVGWSAEAFVEIWKESPGMH